MNPPKINQGDILSNKKLSEHFKCGNMGGMRRSHKTNTLVIVSDHTKGLYDDKWYGNELRYTGMGTKGDQSLYFSQNKTLLNHKTNGVAVHLFEVYERGKYVYQGEVTLSDKPYQEPQFDIENKSRQVWMFPVSLISGAPIRFNDEVVTKVFTKKLKTVKKLSDEELKSAIDNRNERGVPAKKETITTSYDRNPKVVEYALRKADDYCQLCEEPAPFNRKDGSPFLEVHHIEYLSKGGTDTMDNVVALCPNCHRRMHALEDKKDVRKLKNAVKTL